FTVTPGGEHADGLTHNALVPFADGSYLEIVAFPDLDRAVSHRWWKIAAEGGGFADFALLSDDLGADTLALKEIVTRSSATGGRTRPDGIRLEWRTAILSAPLPFIIQDLTSRELRVPQGAAAQHANGAGGIAKAVLDGRLQPHGKGGPRDQLAGLRPDDVHADDPLFLSDGHDLHQAVGLPEREGTTRGAEVVARDLCFRTVLLLGLRLGEADLGDLGVRVHHIGHDVVVHHRVLAEDRVDRHLRSCDGDVGELRRSRITDAVPDGPHAADVRAHAVIDRDAEAVRRKAGLLDTGEVRDPARPEQE